MEFQKNGLFLQQIFIFLNLLTGMKQSVIYFFLLSFILISCSKSKTNSTYDLQNGDLLFSVGVGDSELLTAIQNSTSEDQEIPFSHVGIVSVESEGTFVIEATPQKGVVKTSLEDFFDETAKKDSKLLLTVGRLKPEYQYCIPGAIETAKTHIGKGYDYAYNEANNSFYCSELVRFAYNDSIGVPLFPPLAMSFKNKQTQEIEPYWVEHFEKLNIPVPEGEPGTNPVDMQHSNIIEIVHRYY